MAGSGGVWGQIPRPGNFFIEERTLVLVTKYADLTTVHAATSNGISGENDKIPNVTEDDFLNLFYGGDFRFFSDFRFFGFLLRGIKNNTGSLFRNI